MLVRYARMAVKPAFLPHFSQSRSFAQTNFNTANTTTDGPTPNPVPGSQTSFKYNLENYTTSPLEFYRVK